jgi:hypothetical protein
MVGKLKDDSWLQMRKLASVCAREELRADYEDELNKRMTRPVVKTLFGADYDFEFTRKLDVISQYGVSKASKRGDCRDLEDEWKMRAVSAPTGASSCSILLNVTGRGSPSARPSDRPNKKCVLSALPSTWLASAAQLAVWNFARASTKPEPGNKARTLLASGDWITFISTHALRGMEGSGNYGGMAASQRPEVIGNWLEGCGRAKGAMQVSADLDDYNWQHELWELQEMWCSRARAWEETWSSAAKSKALSCWTIAQSFDCSVVSVEGGLHRVCIGLFSGHRGTTLDNTTKHEIDRLLALDSLSRLGLGSVHYYATESGDDEWLLTDNWVEARNYLLMCTYMGLRMNAKKQLVGEEHGEYLQRCISGDATPRQSLCSILSTLCTGNWYRPLGTWLNSAMESACANWLEASSRGLPRTIAARMCGMVLDNVMVDRYEGKTPIGLNWRKYVTFNSAGKALFSGCPGYEGAVPPDLVVRANCRPNWMSIGVSDYLEGKEANWIMRSLKKEWLIKQFSESIAVDAHGSCEQVFERERNSAIVAARWDKHGSFIPVPLGLPELAPGPGLRATAHAWTCAKNSGRAVTEDDNLAAMGVGGREAQLLGGYEELRRNAPPELASRLQPEYPAPTKYAHVACDPNVLAGLQVHKSGQSGFCLAGNNEKAMGRRQVTVVAATHGSGISRLARRFNQRHVARFDRVARAWSGMDAYHRPSENPERDKQIWRSVAELVASRLASGHRPELKVLLTHEHPNMLVDCLKQQGIEANWILYSPDRVEVARRIAARNLASGVLRYMQATWSALYLEKAPACELVTEEQVIQLVEQKC